MYQEECIMCLANANSDLFLISKIVILNKLYNAIIEVEVEILEIEGFRPHLNLITRKI